MDINVHYQIEFNHFTSKKPKPNKHGNSVQTHCNVTHCLPSTAIAGLVFLLLSLELRHEVKLGIQNNEDLGDFSLPDTRSSLVILSLPLAELALEQ